MSSVAKSYASVAADIKPAAKSAATDVSTHPIVPRGTPMGPAWNKVAASTEEKSPVKKTNLRPDAPSFKPGNCVQIQKTDPMFLAFVANFIATLSTLLDKGKRPIDHRLIKVINWEMFMKNQAFIGSPLFNMWMAVRGLNPMQSEGSVIAGVYAALHKYPLFPVKLTTGIGYLNVEFLEMVYTNPHRPELVVTSFDFLMATEWNGEKLPPSPNANFIDVLVQNGIPMILYVDFQNGLWYWFHYNTDMLKLLEIQGLQPKFYDDVSIFECRYQHQIRPGMHKDPKFDRAHEVCRILRFAGNRGEIEEQSDMEIAIFMGTGSHHVY